ncbi:MAG: diguanylate cyclase [Deltaproteobacteria bacterium]|nr:diguanylate cyclase [Deltaproteobacteria bacterium]
MHSQILDNIETGVLVVNRRLDISFWNRWLAVHTGISNEVALHNNLVSLFPEYSFELLKQKVNIALRLGTPTFIDGKVSGYVLPVEQYKVTKSIYRHMRQDGTIAPINDSEVSIVINDITPLLEAHYTIDQQMQMLARQAKTDSLTGCFNKSMFNDLLATEIKRSTRHSHVFSLIGFDIDDFKKVNDTYGHLTGDAVLRSLAQIVASSIRQSDSLVRWGGEEFFILLPETALDGGARLAEKLRERISANHFEKVGHLSCCFGVAQWEMDVDEDTVISNTDRALYYAKQTGKNKVSTFGNGKCVSYPPGAK